MSEEMKIIGAVVFLVVFMAVFVLIMRSGKNPPPDEQPPAGPGASAPAAKKFPRRYQ